MPCADELLYSLACRADYLPSILATMNIKIAPPKPPPNNK
jgi:hypothetical protein